MEDSVAGPGLAGARCCWLWSMCHRFAQQKGDGTPIASGPGAGCAPAADGFPGWTEQATWLEPAAWRTGA